jgi:polar amino acid transport system permease protein
MAAGVALVIAFVTGLARTSRWLVIHFVTGVYVEIFRGTSGLVQIYVFFYVLPFDARSGVATPEFSYQR